MDDVKHKSDSTRRGSSVDDVRHKNDGAKRGSSLDDEKHKSDGAKKGSSADDVRREVPPDGPYSRPMVRPPNANPSRTVQFTASISPHYFILFHGPR